jgi:hypothetical protein
MEYNLIPAKKIGIQMLAQLMTRQLILQADKKNTKQICRKARPLELVETNVFFFRN